jgi:hypothetical protein
MQKLSLTSLGKNNKSCSIFHNEPNKIWFAFFWILYDFLQNLQDSAKQQYYLRFTFAPGSLELFSHSHRCPRFTLRTLEIFQTLQLSPWDQWRRRLAGIRRHRWGFWPGEVWRRCRGSPATGLRAQLGVEGAGEEGSAALSGGGRGSWCSGEQTSAAGTRGAERTLWCLEGGWIGPLQISETKAAVKAPVSTTDVVPVLPRGLGTTGTRSVLPTG